MQLPAYVSLDQVLRLDAGRMVEIARLLAPITTAVATRFGKYPHRLALGTWAEFCFNADEEIIANGYMSIRLKKRKLELFGASYYPNGAPICVFNSSWTAMRDYEVRYGATESLAGSRKNIQSEGRLTLLHSQNSADRISGAFTVPEPLGPFVPDADVTFQAYRVRNRDHLRAIQRGSGYERMHTLNSYRWLCNTSI